MIPLVAALKGLAALPRLVDSVSALVDKLGSIEKAINEKQVIERMADKRTRNRDAIDRVLAPPSGSGGGTDKPPSV